MTENSQKNYTDEQLNQLLELYNQLGTDRLDEIADIMSKPVKSIRSKLVREGVYKPADKVTIKASGPGKKELLNTLQEMLGFDTSGFLGATKPALLSLLGYLNDIE